jgi:hypothetical protein
VSRTTPVIDACAAAVMGIKITKSTTHARRVADIADLLGREPEWTRT